MSNDPIIMMAQSSSGKSAFTFPNHFKKHWFRIMNRSTLEFKWWYSVKQPPLRMLYSAEEVIVQQDDGSYQWAKHRDHTKFERKLTEEESKEMLFIMLKAENYDLVK